MKVHGQNKFYSPGIRNYLRCRTAYHSVSSLCVSSSGFFLHVNYFMLATLLSFLSNLNINTLQEIQKSMSAMADVMRQMGEARTSLATKRSHDDSDTDDDRPTEVKRQQANLDLFDASEAEALNIDVLDALEDPFKGEDTRGPSVNEKLAAKVNDCFFLTNLNLEVITKKQQSYMHPQNCPKLVVTQCNEEIWRKLQKFQRTADIKTSNIQKVIAAGAAGATALTKILEALLANVKSGANLQISQLVSKGCDALALFGHASQEMSYRRREDIRPTFKEYAGHVSHNVPVTSHLFGHDMLKTMRDLKKKVPL